MKYLLYLLLLIPNINYTQNTQILNKFNELRKNHSGIIAAQSFTATLSSASAKKLVKDKIKGQYYVHIFYHMERGIALKVASAEPFYENILSSYATYINMMMLPLLSTTGYVRLQKKFQVSLYEANIFQVEYTRGDTLVKYLFKEGKLKLVDYIAYYENNKKIFILSIDWKKIQNRFVPAFIKIISYEKTRISGSFTLENIKIKK